MYLKNWFIYFFFLEIDFEFKIEVFDLFLKYDGDFLIVDEVGKFVLDKVIEDYLVFLYLGRYNMLRDFFFVFWILGNI